MTIKEQIEVDLKQSMLAGDAPRTTVLRGLKSTILYAEVEQSKRDEGLSNDEVITLLQKETKKRSEAAELYTQGQSQERADKELYEKQIIEQYLPTQLDEAEIEQAVVTVINELGASGVSDMGRVIAAVRQQTAGQADGAIIARIVKEKLA